MCMKQWVHMRYIVHKRSLKAFEIKIAQTTISRHNFHFLIQLRFAFHRPPSRWLTDITWTLVYGASRNEQNSYSALKSRHKHFSSCLLKLHFVEWWIAFHSICQIPRRREWANESESLFWKFEAWSSAAKTWKCFGSIMFVGQRWDNLIKEMSGGEASQRTQSHQKPQAFIIAFSRQWVSGPFDSHDCWLRDEQKTKKKKREISNITAIHHLTAWRWVKWKEIVCFVNGASFAWLVSRDDGNLIELRARKNLTICLEKLNS